MKSELKIIDQTRCKCIYTYALAYSMFAKKCQYYLHSTNHNRNFDRQNVTLLRPGSGTNGKLNKRNTAT